MNNLKFVFFAFILLPSTMVAQSLTDSITSQVELEEVVVQGVNVIRKADMDVYYPTQTAVAGATNGMTLLGNMLIPSLTVNPVLETIKTSGQDVQLRINGRKATMAQVKALLPQSIKRVEYIDNPGLKYKDAVAVVNFIVTNPETGGALMLSGMQSLVAGWGKYDVNLQINKGKSQFTFDMYSSVNARLDMYREYSELFTYSDGSSLSRVETPIDGYVDGVYLTPNIGYSYINPDKTTFWIGAGVQHSNSQGTYYQGLMTLSNGADDIILSDRSFYSYMRPWMSAYIEQKLPRDQTIVVGLSSTYSDGDTERTYTEQDSDLSTAITDVSTNIKDHNWAYSAELNYIKSWNRSKLTFGVDYDANRNRSTYLNLGGSIYHQSQDRAYMFGEYNQRFGNLNITGGLAAEYTYINSRESDISNNTWSLRPRLMVSYRYNDASRYRLNLNTWTTAPSLSQTNAVMQQIDGFQYQLGNPNLKPYTNYRLTARYNYSHPRIEGVLYASWSRSVDAIMPYKQWDGDRLITSYSNHGSFTRLEVSIAPQITIIPKWLMVEGSLTFSHQKSRGIGYAHIHNGLSGSATMMVTHWDGTFMLQYQDNGGRLWGETIEWGEKMTMAALMYNYRNFQFMCGITMPFSRYSQGSQSLNRYNSNKYTMRGDWLEKMPFIKISYNLRWGQQKQRANRLINTDAEVQTSTAAGR